MYGKDVSPLVKHPPQKNLAGVPGYDLEVMACLLENISEEMSQGRTLVHSVPMCSRVHHVLSML